MTPRASSTRHRRGTKPREAQPNLFHLALHPEEVLDEYLRVALRVPRVRRFGPIRKVFDFIATGAPGVKEVLIAGKVGFEERAEARRTSALGRHRRRRRTVRTGALAPPRTAHDPGDGRRRDDPQPDGMGARDPRGPREDRRRRRLARRGDAGHGDRGAPRASSRRRSTTPVLAIVANRSCTSQRDREAVTCALSHADAHGDARSAVDAAVARGRSRGRAGTACSNAANARPPDARRSR